jgi:hypothetical protein
VPQHAELLIQRDDPAGAGRLELGVKPPWDREKRDDRERAGEREAQQKPRPCGVRSRKLHGPGMGF